MNELMQMRLRSGGTEGLLAEKLEVTYLHASRWSVHYHSVEHKYCCNTPFKSQNIPEESKQAWALWETFPKKSFDFKIVKSSVNLKGSVLDTLKFKLISSVCSLQALITQTRAKQAATMSEVEWRGRTVPVKIDKVRIFLLGLADNEAAIAQVTQKPSLVPVF